MSLNSESTPDYYDCMTSLNYAYRNDTEIKIILKYEEALLYKIKNILNVVDMRITVYLVLQFMPSIRQFMC